MVSTKMSTPDFKLLFSNLSFVPQNIDITCFDTVRLLQLSTIIYKEINSLIHFCVPFLFVLFLSTLSALYVQIFHVIFNDLRL